MLNLDEIELRLDEAYKLLRFGFYIKTSATTRVLKSTVRRESSVKKSFF